MHGPNGERRGSNEFNRRDVYGMRRHLSNATTDLIVDVGTNTGEFTVTAWMLTSHAKLAATEADRDREYEWRIDSP